MEIENIIKKVTECNKVISQQKKIIQDCIEEIRCSSKYKVGDVLELISKYGDKHNAKCWVSWVVVHTSISGVPDGTIGYHVCKIKSDGSKSNQRFKDFFDYDIVGVLN